MKLYGTPKGTLTKARKSMESTYGIGMRSVAVIGYGARLAGADDADQAWDILSNGECTIGPVDEERWSRDKFLDLNAAAAGKSYVARAGLIDNVFDFDAAHFGISPVEAQQMDPQQRILLEVVAQALDHAGIDAAKLDHDRTGVFVGASSSDHSTTALQDPALMNAQYMLGNTLSILSNRIAFTWNLRGPSYTVDTACSSSLYALHHAHQSIGRGEIDTAIVAGVNVLLSPIPFVGFSKAQMLSRVGLCHAFGKDADGYVRAEGAVAFVLRAEKLAQMSKDRIRSRLIGTGTNTDGRKAGMTYPSSRVQTTLLNRVKSDFGVDPDDLAYVEAHGTGTPVGDPEEAEAIGNAYGQFRAKPLPIGSAKTNFGHLEPASGLVGMLKAQMALERHEIPASLHAQDLNPNIPFADLGLSVVRQAQTLERRDKPWLAAVNSFGFGGANAHAVIEGAAPAPARNKTQDIPVLQLTASSMEALRIHASNWKAPAKSANAAQFTQAVSDANFRRTRHRFRVCLPAATPRELSEAIDTWLDDPVNAVGVAGTAQEGGGKVGFLYAGNGAQWVGMGRLALTNDATFRESIEQTSDRYQQIAGVSLLDLLMAADLGDRLPRATVTQPLLLAVQIALTAALAAQGLKPAAVLGHSAGEIAAAYAAGAISRHTALHAAFIRSKTLDRMYRAGGMAALATSVERARDLIARLSTDVDVAAENSGESLTLAGSTDDLKSFLKAARAEKIAGKLLPIEYPYHSRAIDAYKADLIDELSHIEPQSESTDLYSGCLGRRISGWDLTPEYWYRSTREMVRFRDGVKAMARDGVDVFVEISPKTVLRNYVLDTLDEEGVTAHVLGSFEEKKPQEQSPRRVAMRALAHGARLDEAVLLGKPMPYQGALPKYPFVRERFELRSESPLDLFGREVQHTLLGGKLRKDIPIWVNDVSSTRQPWASDHRVDGRLVLPATAMLEAFFEAGADVIGHDRIELRDFEILSPVVLAPEGSVKLRCTYEETACRLRLEKQERHHWELVAKATVLENAASDAKLNIAKQMSDAAGIYPALAESGLQYGPEFALVSEIAVDGQTADLKLLSSTGDADAGRLDLRSLDSALHGAAALLKDHELPHDVTFVPGRVGRFRVFRRGRIARARVRLVSVSVSGDGVCIAATYCDQDGEVLAEATDIRLRPFPRKAGAAKSYWHEKLVPVTAAQDAGQPDLATLVGPRGSDEPTDQEIIREAIAGRLAYDVVADSRGRQDADPRLPLAVAAMCSMGLAEEVANEPAKLVAPCPWPELDALINLLIAKYPEDIETLEAVLAADDQDGVTNGNGAFIFTRAIKSLIAAPDRSWGRILVAGRIGATDFDIIRQVADFVTVAAIDEEHAKSLETELASFGKGSVVTLSQLENGTSFDTILGVDLGSTFSTSEIRALTKSLGQNGRMISIERRQDLFREMTHPSKDRVGVDAVERALVRAKLETERVLPPGLLSLEFVLGALPALDDQALPSCDIVGTCDFADRLRAVAVDAAAEPAATVVVVQDDIDDPLLAAQQIAATLRKLEPNWVEPIWLLGRSRVGGHVLRGWRRSLANETGLDLRCANVAADAQAAFVLRTICGARETELEIAGAQVSSPRLSELALVDRPADGLPTNTLDLGSSRRLENLKWAPAARRKPGAGEIEIEVAATGVNFRDVMWAQGLLPSELLEGGFVGAALGMECSGTVVRTGKGTEFDEGDKIVAFTSSAFASHATLSAATAIRLPRDVDLASAAGMPVIFLTAHYALHELAKLGAGEAVLIHGGAGGVGQAAIQVARQAGATIFATAGSRAKRRLLETLGVDHVLDSRSLAFGAEIEKLTNGHGVDVVLNSIGGEAIQVSLNCLKPFGRFIELGKRDFLADSALRMRALKNNVSFFGVDVDQLLVHRPALAHGTLQDVVACFETGAYSIPPTRRFPAEAVVDAFRTMQKSSHIGKIVVEPLPAAAGHAPGPDQNAPALGSSWLITGGTRGFGLATAKWLAGRGVRNLWLLGRSGEISDEDRRDLERAGATVATVAADVANEADLEKAIQKIVEAGVALDGVVHAAVVFGDGPFRDARPDGIARRMKVKLGGAMNLHRQTQRFALKHFWLYSSVAARFGNINQSEYVASNSGLEWLAEMRRADGLPALAIAWGPIADAGYLANEEDLRAVVGRVLGQPMTKKEAFAHLDAYLASGCQGAGVTIARADWQQLQSDFIVARQPLFEAMHTRKSASASGSRLEIAELVRKRGPAKARKQVVEMLIADAAEIMRMSPREIEPERPLTEMGFDSLMAMNLKLAVEERVGMDIPMGAIGDGITLTQIAAEIVQDASGGAKDGQMTERMAASHLTESALDAETKDKIARIAES